MRLVEKNWPLAKVRDLLNVSYLKPYLQNHVKKICLFMQAIKYFYSWRKILICWMSILVIHFLCLWSLQNQESLVDQNWRNNHLHVDQQWWHLGRCKHYIWNGWCQLINEMNEAKLKGIHVIILAPWKKSNLWTINA